jgi:hypothetical protein
MSANVRYDLESPFIVQAQKKGDGPCVGLNEITRHAELAAVPHVQPAPGEYCSLLQRKDSRICEDLAADRPIAAVNEASQLIWGKAHANRKERSSR